MVEPLFFKESFVKRHEKGRKLKAEGKLLMGLTCTYIPEELLIASGAMPVKVSGSLGGTPRADSYLPVNICSTMRSILEASLKGDYDYLDGVIFSNSCDNMGRCFDRWKLHLSYSYLHFFNTPHSKTSNAFKRYLYEVKKLKKSLETFLKVEVPEDELRKAINLLNEERLLLSKLYELRTEDPPLLTGVEAFYILAYSITYPKEEVLKSLRELVKEPPKLRSEFKDRPRVLVSCSIIDNEAKLISMVEDSGGIVVVDDTCTGTRYFEGLVKTSSPPLEAIAERYLNKVPCAFTQHGEERFAYLKELIKRYHVEGVILYCVKFCDTYLFDAPMLMEELKDIGIPATLIEWSHVEAWWAPLKTRVEAFIESLR